MNTGEIQLLPSEIEKLDSFDSREFGFLNVMQNADKATERRLIFKGIQYYGRKLLLLIKGDNAANNSQPASDLLKMDDPEILAEISRVYLKLGHLHLLTDDFAKALSAYQHYFTSCTENLKNPYGLYGLGLVYFHLKQHKLVIEVFRDLLYSYPNFSRSCDVHIRLGVSYKMLENWNLALKHLNSAFVGSGPCTFPKLEIRFLIACCYDDQNNFKKAKEEYEAISQNQNCTPQLKASVLRQIGWLFFRFECAGPDKNTRLNYAIDYLQESTKLDPSCGQTYYFLGRCLSVAGRAQEAFFAYRHSIDKTESSADTWCSIGVLYQKQQQPMDALQAYICAVQLDEDHVEAWVDLGKLYEKYGQPKDALQCYTNALKRNAKGKADLVTRVNILETELKSAPPIPPSFKKTLPSLEEAWHLPIPAELTNRQDAIQKQKITNYIRGPLISAALNYPDETVQKAPICYLSAQQIQLMHILQQNQGQLNSAQLQLLRQLQDAYALSQQQQKIVSQRPSQANLCSSAIMPDNLRISAELQSSAGASTPAGELPQVSQEDLQAFLGIGGDSEDLGGGTGGAGGIGGTGIGGSSGQACTAGATRDSKHDPILAAAFLSSSIDKRGSDQEMTDIGSHNDRLSGESDLASIPPSCNLTAPIKVQPVSSITSAQIIDAVKNRGRPGTAPILDEVVPPPNILANLPNSAIPKDKLLLPTPSIMVYTKKEAAAPELQQFCYQSPVVVIRGMSSALRLDLGLFSTKSLMLTAGEHQVEVRTQYFQPPDQNFDLDGEKGWHCESTRSFTTVAKYAQYQAQSFQQSLKEEQEKLKAASSNRVSNASSAEADNSTGRKINEEGQGRFKILKFGTNVDLSDERKWKLQLDELNKLPSFCRVTASSNMLSHLGHVVLGMNTVQLYIKVPGCRTPGHQENNNFASVNINIGPGECEWFSVPYEYWGAIKELCDKNKVDYLRGSWWPPLEDLWEHNIPVYRFTQRSGDIVWVGPGTVHWVQSTGWCNNIAWNIGSMTPVQYQMALERYEWNKLESYKSIVPMTHLSWQLARNVKFSDPKFYELIKGVLVRSLYHCAIVLEFVTEKLRKEIKYHARVMGETAHYCAVCDQEVFNILFVLNQERKFFVHCLNCALRIDAELKSFVILHQYLLEELISTFDNFQIIPKKPGLIC